MKTFNSTLPNLPGGVQRGKYPLLGGREAFRVGEKGAGRGKTRGGSGDQLRRRWGWWQMLPISSLKSQYLCKYSGNMHKQLTGQIQWYGFMQTCANHLASAGPCRHTPAAGRPTPRLVNYCSLTQKRLSPPLHCRIQQQPLVTLYVLDGQNNFRL